MKYTATIKQYGQTVVRFDGDDIERVTAEINHYASQYEQDGEIIVKIKENSKCKT